MDSDSDDDFLSADEGDDDIPIPSNVASLISTTTSRENSESSIKDGNNVGDDGNKQGVVMEEVNDVVVDDSKVPVLIADNLDVDSIKESEVSDINSSGSVESRNVNESQVVHECENGKEKEMKLDEVKCQSVHDSIIGTGVNNVSTITSLNNKESVEVKKVYTRKLRRGILNKDGVVDDSNESEAQEADVVNENGKESEADVIDFVVDDIVAEDSKESGVGISDVVVHDSKESRAGVADVVDDDRKESGAESANVVDEDSKDSEAHGADVVEEDGKESVADVADVDDDSKGSETTVYNSVADDSKESDSVVDDSKESETIVNDRVVDDSKESKAIVTDKVVDDSKESEIIVNDAVVDDSKEYETIVYDTVVDDSKEFETIVNDAVVDDSKESETIVNDAVVDDSKESETIVNDTVVDDSKESETIVDDTVVDDSKQSGTIVNDTVIDDGKESETIVNDTVVDNGKESETIVNDTVVDDCKESDTIVNDTDVNYINESETIVNDLVVNDSKESETIVNDTVVDDSKESGSDVAVVKLDSKECETVVDEKVVVLNNSKVSKAVDNTTESVDSNSFNEIQVSNESDSVKETRTINHKDEVKCQSVKNSIVGTEEATSDSTIAFQNKEKPVEIKKISTRKLQREVNKNKKILNKDSENTKKGPTTATTTNTKSVGHPKVTNSTDQTNDAWGWDSWADNFIAQAGTKVATMIESVEEQLGIPDPYIVAKNINTEGIDDKKKENVTTNVEKENTVPAIVAKEESVNGHGEQKENVSSWFTSFVPSAITNIVQNTGQDLVSGGIDALEYLGKSTVSYLSDGDPGLRNKRKALFNKKGQTLSSILQEAKVKNEEKNLSGGSTTPAGENPKKLNDMLEKFQAIAHLDAIQMLSTDCESKLKRILGVQSGSKSGDESKETVNEIEKNFELDEDDENHVRDDVMDFKKDLFASTKRLKLKVTCSKLLNTWAKLQSKTETMDYHGDSEKCFECCISSLAELVARCVEYYRKVGDMLIMTDVNARQLAVERATALKSVTEMFQYEVRALAMKFSSHLADMEGDVTASGYITDICMESENCSSLVNDSHLLLLPILQCSAIK